MDHDTLLAHVRADHDRTQVAATAAGLDAPVVTCGDWTVRDLVEHLSLVYRHKVACIELQAEPEPWPPPDRHVGDPLVELDAAHERLQEVLGSHAPGDPAWTWEESDRTVGFWVRRMAHETAVHRADAELAAGTTPVVDAALAADGVDELLRVFAEGDWSDVPQPGPATTVVLHVPGRAWTVRSTPDRLAVGDGADEAADATVHADASDLLLWLWGRPHGELAVDGAPDAAEALQRRLAVVTT
ncbi:maleylpyruvate isomerase family mycothiol-dependent enzyme [Aquipuribacter nitratireducens]|uniref:Maleylpyruvate isomerase family mycothiol-dependent enzyme n=1 Tax=Aquipuribacter nitratireducens TaxID=650104 RepID=A0ABW0GLS1_9MICO